MRPSRRRWSFRISRFEPIEPRLVLSSNPTGDFALEYFVESRLYDEVLPALVDAHDLTGLTAARQDYGFTGLGQTVVVIDSGIAYDHVALGGGFGAGYRIVGGYDFTDQQDDDPYDNGPYGSHGTHVAGIIGSSDVYHPGVAPGVDLVALRVFNDSGQGRFDWVEEALSWVHDNRNAFANPITTVNLSMGSSFNGDGPPPTATLEDELAQLEADGIFISVAAGNSFTTYQQPGLSYPAASGYVVPVSSVDDGGTLSYFTQRHQRVIAAPGRGVLSTVPDYVGNRNGLDDDFARYSGTSMAAPYVAGASVLLRQAYEFVGIANATQDTIYNLMRTTADVIYDAANNNQNYHRLNLRRALDQIMPEDDFGSSAATAYRLGTVVDTRSFNGTIGQLDDRDYVAFAAGRSGRVTFSIDVTHDLKADWELVGQADAAVDADGTFSFDVLAGESYIVGLGTNGGLGHYTTEINLEAGTPLPEAETIIQKEFLDQQITATGTWFAFTAAQQGILTVEAFFSNSSGDVDLQLFDANLQLVAASYTTRDSERIDVAAADGETFYLHVWSNGPGANRDVDLRVTNLVALDGNTVNVRGTDGDDVFTFHAGPTHRLSVNGVDYTFNGTRVSSVSFNGLAGSDTVTLNGTVTKETAVIRVGLAELTGSDYRVRVANVENVGILGGGGLDIASFFDSAGNDTFRAAPGTARLVGPGFSHHVAGFERVHAYARSGGFDAAYLHDSAGNDVFIATPIVAKLYGQGFFHRAKYFEAVHAYANSGGNDLARLYDSPGNDVFVGTPNYGKLAGNGYLNRAKFFDRVIVRANSGGYDRAYLYDSALDDHFEAVGNMGKISNEIFATWIYGFDNIRVLANKGGTNTSELDSVDYVLQLLGDWEW